MVLFVESAGIFQVFFDNSYSWYNEKKIRFRVLVLEPENKNCEE